MTKVLGTRLGVIGRNKNGCVLKRSSYGHSGYVMQSGQLVQSTKPSDIYHHQIHLPASADRRFEDPELLWNAAKRAEKRKDAVEAHHLDITLPRELPPESWVAVANRVSQRFVEHGLAVQSDIHCPPARDGQPNPHVHLLISARRLEGAEFSARKSAELQKIFRTGFGRPLRKRLANLINEVAVEYGLPAALVTATPEEKANEAEPRAARRVMKKSDSVLDKSQAASISTLRSARKSKRPYYFGESITAKALARSLNAPPLDFARAEKLRQARADEIQASKASQEPQRAMPPPDWFSLEEEEDRWTENDMDPDPPTADFDGWNSVELEDRDHDFDDDPEPSLEPDHQDGFEP